LMVNNLLFSYFTLNGQNNNLEMINNVVAREMYELYINSITR